MASVRKRKWTHDGVEKEAWQVDYKDQDGKRRSKQFDKKKDADRFRLKVETEISEGVHTPDRATITFAAAAEAYLRDCDRRHKIGDRMTGQTLHAYSYSVDKYLVPRFGKLKLNAITTLIVQKYIDEISTASAWRTVRRHYMLISNIMDFGVGQHFIKRNVLRDIPARLPRRGKDRVRMPNKTEIMAVLEAVGRRDRGEDVLAHINRRLIAHLGLFCGLRIGEITGLQWADVDMHARTINVRHSLGLRDGLKGPKTEAGRRVVPMPDVVASSLRSAMAYWQTRREIMSRDGLVKATKRNILRQAVDASLVAVHEPGSWRPDGFVLKTTREAPIAPTAGNTLFRRVLKEAGLVDGGRPLYSIHSLRHAFVSLMIAGGLPLVNLTKVAGHSRSSTTLDVYSHMFAEDDRAAQVSDAIAAEFNATSKQHGALVH